MVTALQLPMAFLLDIVATRQATANAATLPLAAEAGVPTQNFFPACQQPGMNDTLGWIAFAKAALPDARPMHDWERQDADQFFWSQFE